ncbi:MAG: undecaprenyl-diphosphate phosphatase [Fusobacterium sp.]|nr:undecaprenyl-diphosphate phosphatase [Fusobacterium sp.]
MNLIQAILMGIVQGLSEFLPISSSAHLVFTSNFYKVFKGIEIADQSSQEIFFDIMLHLGTLIAVLVFFRKDIWVILKAMFNALKTRDFSDLNARVGFFILIGTFVTVLIAYPLNEVAAGLIYLPFVVGLLLIITGGVLFLSEHLSKRAPQKSEVDLKTSVLMSIAQGLAALPGFSRSGLTIATGLFCGLDRTTAARFSFLLSIPIILGASMVYPIIKLDLSELLTYNWLEIIVGTVVSGLVGYVCIKYFLKFVSNFSLNIFGVYCILTGIFTSVFFYLNR